MITGLSSDTKPTSPADGMLFIETDTDTARFYVSSGGVWTNVTNPTYNKKLYNESLTSQAGFATDTYLTGSSIQTNDGSIKAGTRYHLLFDVSKTAAGVAAPVLTVRLGTSGSTADTARLTFTFNAQTAVADIGTFEVWVTFRQSGASTIVQGLAQVRHRLSITGLQNLVSTTLQVTSAAFDSTVSNSIIGVSVNAGASAAWTVQTVQAELQNII